MCVRITKTASSSRRRIISTGFLSKREGNIVVIMPLMMGTVYTCILLISWFGAHMIISNELYDRSADEPSGILHEYPDYEPYDGCNGFVMVTIGTASARRIAEVLNEKSSLTNPEKPVYEVADGSIDFSDVDFLIKRDNRAFCFKGY